jgi:hypothetical protein
MTLNKLAPRAPRNPQAKPLPIRLTPDELAKVDQYASHEVRSRSALARMMFLRGLESYERELAAR